MPVKPVLGYPIIYKYLQWISFQKILDKSSTYHVREESDYIFLRDAPVIGLTLNLIKKSSAP